MGNKIGFGGEEAADNYPSRVLLLGLDGAGKSTALAHMKTDKGPSKDAETVPTVGFNVETVRHQNQTFIVWDVGGQHKIRPLWKHYFAHTDAIIFVVDSSDTERIQEAKSELDGLLSEPELAKSVLLILCNKCDISLSLSTGELAEALQLDRMRKRQWFITPTIANKGVGLVEGLNWLADALKANKAVWADASSSSSATAPPIRPCEAKVAKPYPIDLKDDPTLAKAKAAEALAQAALAAPDGRSSLSTPKSHAQPPSVSSHVVSPTKKFD